MLFVDATCLLLLTAASQAGRQTTTTIITTTMPASSRRCRSLRPACTFRLKQICPPPCIVSEREHLGPFRAQGNDQRGRCGRPAAGAAAVRGARCLPDILARATCSPHEWGTEVQVQRSMQDASDAARISIPWPWSKTQSSSTIQWKQRCRRLTDFS